MEKKKDYVLATRKASRVGKSIGLFFILFGLLSFFAGSPGGFWFLLIGWFVYSAAQSSYLQASLQDTLKGIPVGKVMVKTPEIVSLHPTMTIEDAVNYYFLRHGFGGFPVMENGKLLGMTTLKEIKNVPREKWAQVTIREALVPHEKRWEVSPEDDVMEALQRMIQEDQGRIIVTRNDRIVGLITRNGIARYVQLMGR